MSNLKKQLLNHFSSLSEQDQRSLVSYAEFLTTREASADSMGLSGQAITQAIDIPRPDNESVVKAIKRLSATYPMLDKSLLLNEISNYMTKHIINGVSAADVIDSLELEFKNQYEKWQQ